MGAFFVYILKSAVCLAGFYLFYRLLLSRETFHRFNRVALLGLLVFSCVVPLVEVTVEQPTGVGQQFLTLEEMMLMVDMAAPMEAETALVPLLTWREVLLLVYFLGIVFFLMRHVWSLCRMLRLIKGSAVQKREDGITLISHRKQIAPFSWMKFVVISEKDLNENGREILTHECAHIRNRHSIDLLVADVCIFFQWFNPAAWLLKQELQNIHEYEADESVIAQGIDAKSYQLLLIKKAVGTRLYSMANSFNHSSLKKRITMMMKKKSNPWARAKYLYVLPLAAVAVAAFARPEVSNELKEISAVKVNDLTAIMQADEAKSVETPAISDEKKAKVQSADQNEKDSTFMVVEQMPEFPGGMGECMKFLGENIRYPEVAHKNGVQGRVIMQFVVDKDGSITDPKVVRSVSPEIDSEAIRVIKAMPKWKPGRQRGKEVRVRYTIPVMFRLQKSEPAEGTSDSISTMTINVQKNAMGVLAVRGGKFDADAPTLIIVDGKKSDNATMSKLDPKQIEAVTVLKDEAAIAEYGDEGKNGVILITTKKK